MPSVVELILRRDSRLDGLLNKFEHKRSGDSSFLEMLHDLISKLLSCLSLHGMLAVMPSIDMLH
jgi:hypothetical protein